MNDMVLQIILASIPVIGIIITALITPLLKSKLSEKQRENILFWTEIAVIAIEKHYEGEVGQGVLKKEYVMEFLKNSLQIDKYITEHQLSVIVDAVVEEIVNRTY